MSRARRIGRLAACTAMVWAGAAAGSPLFELAGDSIGQGGHNARVTAPGAASAYFNPALLADADQQFDVGFLVLSDQISMTLDGRPGGDVPLVVGDRTALDGRTLQPIPNDTVPTDWLERGCAPSKCGHGGFAPRPRQASGSSGHTHSYASIGLVSHVLAPWLTLGLHALVPIGAFTQMQSFYPDEREQVFTNSLHPELYSDRMTATSLAFGAGARLTRTLSAGMSFTLSLTNTAVASTYVRDPVDYGKLQLDNRVSVDTPVAPHFGVSYTPTKRVRLSVTLHTEQKLVLHTGVGATLPAGTESRTTLTEVHSFVPWTAAVGGSVELTPHAVNRFSFAWTAAYEAWSRYRDRHGERPEQAGAAYAWRDVIRTTAGLRHARGRIRNFVDVSLQPTPVPLQVGRTNYVDNDRVGIAAGTDIDLRVGSYRLRPGIGLHADRLLRRYQAKDDARIRDELPDGAVDKNLRPVDGASGLQTNNPGWPGFASEGWILGANVWVALLY